MTDKTLRKYTIRAYEEDMDIVISHYPDFGYNRIVRHMIGKLADRIRSGREDALQSVLKEIGEYDE